MQLGKIGIWTGQFEGHPASDAQEAVAELEQLGYGAVWVPESRGRESFTQAALLLGGSRRIVVATGITNLYGRDPLAMLAAQLTLAEAYSDRFLLGIGVSHAPSVEGLRGHRYERPLQTMRAYLDRMDAAPFLAAVPPTDPPRVLAALGPKMVRLAAERAWGAHPYFVPVAHTAEARRVLGPGPLLAPEQAVVLETDPARAREIARTHTVHYLRLENYANNLRRLGYTEHDLANGGSDRLVDDLVAWGDLEEVVARVQAHFEAGADHVCLQVLLGALPHQTIQLQPGAPPVRGISPAPLPRSQWRALATALLL